MKKLLAFFAILLFTVAARGPGSQPINLAWDATPGAELYTLYQDGLFVADVLPPQTTYTVWPTAEGWFSFYVTEWQSGVESDPSNVVTVNVVKFKGRLIVLYVQ